MWLVWSRVRFGLAELFFDERLLAHMTSGLDRAHADLGGEFEAFNHTSGPIHRGSTAGTKPR